MDGRIAALRDSVKSKNEEVTRYFDQLGDADPQAEDVKRIKDLNKTIEEEERQLQDLLAVSGVKTAALQRTKDWVQPANTLPFPGAPPESSGDRAASQQGGALKSVGEQWLENDAIKAWRQNGDTTKSPVVQFNQSIKTLVTGLSDTQGGAFITTDRQPFVEPGVFRRPLVIRDLVRVLTTTSDAVDFVRIGTPTNNAAIVPEATSTSDAAARKPESAIALEVVTTTMKWIAHFIPVTRQALDDAPQVRDIIDEFLRYGLDEELEDQVLNGSGIGNNFTGITNTAGTQSQAFDTDILTTTRKARTLVELNARTVPTAYVFNPLDWQTIDLLQDNEARYYYGGPAVLGMPRLWGLPVVTSEAMTQGTAVVADWRKAIIWDRNQTRIFVTDSHSDWFTLNILAILAELRAGFAITQPKAFVEVDLTA